jgi:hypothetical protein
MKRLLLLGFIFSFSASTISNANTPDTTIGATTRDTIITPFHFTILGIGTKNAQIAVIGNIAPPGFRGTQIAGIFNIGNGPIAGIQIAGLNNHASDSLTGMQLAGGLNTVHGNVRGVQASGGLNATDGNVFGVQLSGGANIAAGDVSQLQASGGLNYAHNLRGLQLTGGLNVVSGTMTGMQISGGMNYAKNMKGVQLGVFNFADSADGVMIGLFSFARHGYHKIEVGWNETTPANLSFLTGSKRFHNVFSVSFDPRPRDPFWGFGYGFGTAWRIHKRIDMDLTAVQYHISKGYFSTSMSDLFKLSLTFDIHLTKDISLAAGPSLNVFVANTYPVYGEHAVTGFAPYYFFTQTYSNQWNAKAWAGFNASLRFL